MPASSVTTSSQVAIGLQASSGLINFNQMVKEPAIENLKGFVAAGQSKRTASSNGTYALLQMGSKP